MLADKTCIHNKGWSDQPALGTHLEQPCKVPCRSAARLVRAAGPGLQALHASRAWPHCMLVLGASSGAWCGCAAAQVTTGTMVHSRALAGTRMLLLRPGAEQWQRATGLHGPGMLYLVTKQSLSMNDLWQALGFNCTAGQLLHH